MCPIPTPYFPLMRRRPFTRKAHLLRDWSMDFVFLSIMAILAQTILTALESYREWNTFRNWLKKWCVVQARSLMMARTCSLEIIANWRFHRGRPAAQRRAEELLPLIRHGSDALHYCVDRVPPTTNELAHQPVDGRHEQCGSAAQGWSRFPSILLAWFLHVDASSLPLPVSESRSHNHKILVSISSGHAVSGQQG